MSRGFPHLFRITTLALSPRSLWEVIISLPFLVIYQLYRHFSAVQFGFAWLELNVTVSYRVFRVRVSDVGVSVFFGLTP